MHPHTNFSEALIVPFILFRILLLFFRCEIIFNAKILANFLHRFTLHQAGDLGSGELKQGYDIKVLAGHNEFKHKWCVEVDELCLPWIYNFKHVSAGNGLVDLGWSLINSSQERSWKWSQNSKIFSTTWRRKFGSSISSCSVISMMSTKT